MKEVRCLAALLIVTVAVFIPSLLAEFVFDDHYLITKNSILQSSNALQSAFTRDYYGQSNPQYALGYYRPLTITTHWLDWQMWRMNPAGHHLTNILLHCAVIIVLFYLIRHLLESLSLSFLTALIFAVHPAHTGTVTFISGRVDALAALFALLSLLFFMKRPVMSAAAYLAALLSKEISVTMPALALWKGKNTPKRAATHSLLLFLVLIITACVRWFLFGSHTRFALDPAGILHALRAFAGYLRFLVFPPAKLYFEPKPEELPLLPGFLALAVFAAAWTYVRNNAIRGWSLVWFVTLIPVLGLVVLETSLDERFLYLPSVGFCLLAAGCIVRYLESSKAHARQRSMVIAAIVIILVYAPLTIVRQMYWQNDIALWSAAIETAPESAKNRLRLGIAYLEQGDLASARSELQHGLRSSPDSQLVTAAAYTHLAVVEQLSGNGQLAETLYRRALETSPDYYTAHYNIAEYYAQTNRVDQAIAEFKVALKLNPMSVQAHKRLAELLASVGLYAEAEYHQRMSTAIRD